MNRIVAHEIEIRYSERRIKEGLINSSETVGGFRGASEDAAAPNGLCPPEL